MECYRCGKELKVGPVFVSRTPLTAGDGLPIFCPDCSDARESYSTTLFELEVGAWWADHLHGDMVEAARKAGKEVAERVNEVVIEVLADA